ncbi:MAG: hypothetical protein J0H15_04430 [Xanthomonadales bacterium]|nr:hypothetical protein [Xanthomonadales bacterium]
MRQVTWWGLVLGFASALTLAHGQPEGLLLSFEVGQQMRLVTVAPASRTSPPRPASGIVWEVAASDRDGRALWEFAFGAPRLHHAAQNQAATFTLAVPAISAGDRIQIKDATGEVRWSYRFDADSLAAAAADLSTARNRDAAYEATAGLQASAERPALTRQLRHQLTTRPSRSEALRDPLAAPARKDEGLQPQKASSFRVTGSVQDANSIRVRAFDAVSGRFVVSTEQTWYDRRFELALEAGTYVFEFDDNQLRIDSGFFYREPARTPPIRISSDTQLAPVTRPSAAGEFTMLAQVPCAQLDRGEFLPGYVETWAANGAHVEREAYLRRTTTPAANGVCETQATIRLSPGDYTIALAPLGWEAVRFDAVQITAGQRATAAALFPLSDRSLVWRGALVDASRRPLGGAYTLADDQLEGSPFARWPDATGRFEIPYRRGWMIALEPFWWGAHPNYVRSVHTMDGTPPPATVVIEDLALDTIAEDGLLRFYGNGDRQRRFNILFLADGYTDVRESFTDVDGNGLWDGVVWLDLDQDGSYSYADRVQHYNAACCSNHEPGSLPDTDNEPFVDLNGDGVLSLDDPNLFMTKARDFMRALLGSDFWAEHRNAFNAYALFEPSVQAGYSVIDADGRRVLDRETTYGATVDLARGLVTFDSASATARALDVLPEVDLVVVLLNEPVWTGARATITLASPASMSYPAGAYDRMLRDLTPSHELGHFVGSLCDEYEEFYGVNPFHGSSSIWCPNASYSTQTDAIPWGAWLSWQSGAVPSRDLSRSIGVFEGANYYPGGAYRPSFSSVMRSTSSMGFNEPSRAALLDAVRRRTGETHGAPRPHNGPPPLVLPSRERANRR